MHPRDLFISISHTLNLEMTESDITFTLTVDYLCVLGDWCIFYVLQNHPYSSVVLEHWFPPLTQHVTSHDLGCLLCLMSGNNVCPIQILCHCFARDDSVYINNMCSQIRSGEASILPHSIIEKKCADSVKWSHWKPSISCHHHYQCCVFITCMYCWMECR